MMEHSHNFSIEKAKQLINSPAGKQLLSMLQNADSEAVRKAIAQVNNGDLEGAKDSLQNFASAPQVQQLLSQLEKP